MFRVIIAGTRHFNDYGLLREYADKLLENKRAAGEKIIILSLSLSLSLSLLFTLTTQSPFAIISRRRTAMLF